MEAAPQTIRHLMDGVPDWRALQSTPGVYPDFKTESFLNHDAPSSTVAFVVGGVLVIASAVLWLHRFQTLKKRRGGNFGGPSRKVQAMLACAFDSDDPVYTTVSYAAASFLFLGGFRENFQVAWVTAMCVYFVTSLADTVRTLLAYHNYDALDDPNLLSDIDRAGVLACPEEECRDKNPNLAPEPAYAEEHEGKFENIALEPGNIYEDMGRDPAIVYMVFVMQVFFITLVCIDTYNHAHPKCFDGTSGCPVVHTVASYILYVIGIFLACVYMLGPKTHFGRSEQDPEFWLILLLAAKSGGFNILWEDPMECPVHSNKGYSRLKDRKGKVIKEEDGVTDKLFHCHHLTKGDTRMWRRFLMSFICNGVGYHILVHALPIQVAMQSTWMGAVFRSVGMMYLVDLDDTKGYPLTIVRHGDDGDELAAASSSSNGTGATQVGEGGALGVDVLMRQERGESAPSQLNRYGFTKVVSGEKTKMKEERKRMVQAKQAREIIERAHDAIDRLQQFGPKKKEEEKEETPRKLHRQISSDSVIMSVIGFGITGLGGSTKRKQV